jgi:SNF2 family DNA or RNA helicase
MPIVAEIDEANPKKIKTSEHDWRFQEILKALPTSHWDKKTSVWRFNLNWQTCLALKAELGDLLIAGPKLKQWMSDEYHNRILPAYTLRDKIEAEGYERLFPHQRGDVQFLSTAERAILANGLGSGKSQSAFSTLRYLYEHKNINPFPVLIACPNSTKLQWKDEIEEVWPGLKVAVIDGTVTKRRKALAEQNHVIIINWESIRAHSRLLPYGSIALKKCLEHGGNDPKISAATCEVHAKELNEISFNSVIADEAHRMKDPSSKMARALKAATGDARYRFALTGTPVASAPDDLFSILHWLMPDAYPSKVKYLDRFCQTHSDAFGTVHVSGIRKEMQPEFFSGLDPFLRRMPKELILPFLPPILRTRRDVEMGAKQKKAYEQMRDQMLAELDDDVITTSSALTKMLRMLQFASAFGTVDYREVVDKDSGETYEKAFVTLSDPSSTLDAFMEDLPDFGGESIVVFAVSKQLINMLSARLSKAGIYHGLITGDQDAETRQMHMKAFQAGQTQLILCTIAAGGTGITLTKGRYGVFLQRSWSMIENTQAEGRVHRIGSQQHESIHIIDYVTAGSCQETVFKAVEEKGKNLEFILRDKELMKKYLKSEDIELPDSEFTIEETPEDD